MSTASEALATTMAHREKTRGLHTPGPWTLGDENNACCEVQAGPVVISLDRADPHTGVYAISREEMLANAHLVIAAPGLFAEVADLRADRDTAAAVTKTLTEERDGARKDCAEYKMRKDGAVLAVADLIVQRDAAIKERDELLRWWNDGEAPIEQMRKAEAFKTYVHETLDSLGVPVDPAPEQTAASGCRIEGRLMFLAGSAFCRDGAPVIDELNALAARVKELEALIPRPDQVVILREDYERLIGSLPAGPRVVR